MSKRIVHLALASLLWLVPAASRAQYADEWTADPEGGSGAQAGPPAPEAPSDVPPAPPATPPAPPEGAQPQARGPAPAGQWIQTQQYGWVWMPYSDAYTSVPADGYGEPYAYVFYPAESCWTWIAAPWVWGFGPWPFFGSIGPVRFAWYRHGWWREPGRWHYAPYYGRGYGSRFAPAYGGGRVRPAPAYRGGSTVRAPPFRGGFAPAHRSAGFRGFAPGGRGGGFSGPRFTGRHGSSFARAPSGGGRGGFRGFGGGGRGHR